MQSVTVITESETQDIPEALPIFVTSMAAAAIIAIRNKLQAFGGAAASADKQGDLLGRLPPREIRELDIELGMLLAG